MPEIDWDRVPGTEITFPAPIDGHAKGVLQHYHLQRRSWRVQIEPGRRGVFQGEVQDRHGQWQLAVHTVDEPQLVYDLPEELLRHWCESGLVQLPTKPTMFEALAAALNEGLADAERARRRAEALTDD